MNNERNLSEYSNYSLIQPIKQQIYDFTSQSDRIYEENIQPLQFKNAMTIKTKPVFENYMWKPKLPSKKLF